MRPRLVIAALSGVVLGLMGLTLYQARQLRAAHRELNAAVFSPPTLTGETGQRPVRLRLQQLPAINLPTRVEQLDWRSIESDDYAAYVANLRRIGCPEETLRDIILADVNQLFATRQRALRPPQSDWEYWRHPEESGEEHLSDAARDHEAALLELERERRNLLAELLGPGVEQAEYAQRVAEALDDRSLQFLPPEKRQAVAEAQARLQQAEEELELGSGGEEADQRATAARRAYESALNAALTPAEREQLELRTSPLASGLREKLRGFGASREEFEALFRLERQAAEERERIETDPAAATDPQLAQRLEASLLELEQKVRESLGPKRFAEYRRAQDADYQTLYSLTREHDVPTTVANEVYDMRHAVEQHTDRIRANPLLTAEQKIRAFEAIRAETRTAIVEVLGEPLLDEYSRMGGRWLLDLTDPQNLGETGMQIVPPPLPEPVPELVPDAVAAERDLRADRVRRFR